MRYNLLRYQIPKSSQPAVAEKLLKLGNRLDRNIPEKDADEHLPLATWNIRDFGKRNNRGFGKRLPESLFYIAEIISRFDFVALQEVNDLYDLETVMNILGDDWDYIATDVTDRKLGGNGERLTYVFDKRKVKFQNIAGEIVLPADMLISESLVEEDGSERVYRNKQFRRTPFTARFQAGWFRFEICTVHIYFGEESGDKLQQRVQEISRIAEYFGQRAEEAEKDFRSLILLGDFNIVHPAHDTMRSLLDQGFELPEGIGPSNLGSNKYYDQIAFKARPCVLDFVDSGSQDQPNSGIFDLFNNVFTARQFDDYNEAAASSPNGKKCQTEQELKKYYKLWRTYQISDHKPLWVRLKINDSPRYLEALKEGRSAW